MKDPVPPTASQYNKDQSTPDPEEDARFDAQMKVAIETVKKHGYYYAVLGEQERIAYVAALAHDDEDEIALLRAQIEAALALSP